VDVSIVSPALEPEGTGGNGSTSPDSSADADAVESLVLVLLLHPIANTARDKMIRYFFIVVFLKLVN
jgi:hypothetical protein